METTVDRLAFRPYFDQIRVEFGRVRAIQTGTKEEIGDISLTSMYVPLRLANQPIPSNLAPKEWPETTNLLEAILPRPVLAILGDPGCGKSTIVGWLSHMLAAPAANIYRETLFNHIPLPMVLREMRVTADLTWDTLLDAFLAQRFNQGSLTRAQLDAVLESGQAYIIVDGFDEVSDLASRLAVSKALFDGQMLHGTSSNRWLVTSRITGYTSAPFRDATDEIYLRLRAAGADGSQKSVLLEQLNARRLFLDHAFRSPNDFAALTNNEHETHGPFSLADAFENISVAPSMYVAPFSPEATRQYIQNWYAARESSETRARAEAQDFLAKLHTRADLCELAQSPQLLTMMCLVHRVYTELPDGRAELYSRVTDAYFEGIPKNRGLAVPYPIATSKRWLARVGFELQRRRSTAKKVEADSGILVSREDLRAWLADEAIRLGEANQNVDRFIEFATTRGGLLAERGQNLFAFLHLSFQEYFAALHLSTSGVWLPRDDAYEAFLGTSEVPVSTVTLPDFIRWSGEPVWQETYRLFFQILPPEQIGRAILHVLDPFERRVRDKITRQVVRSIEDATAGHLLGAVALDSHVKVPDAVRHLLSRRLIKLESDHQSHLSPRANFDPAFVSALTPVVELFEAQPVEPNEASAWTRLNVRGEPVTDISPLTRLTALTSLNLMNTQVTDVSPLAGLTALTSLYLKSIQVTDVSPLAGLTALTSLNLMNTQVTDVSPLASLTALTSLNLMNTQVTDVSPLASMTALTSLNLMNTQVTDVSPLASMTALTSLSLSASQVTDLSPLTGLTALTSLILSNSQVTDVSPLASLTALNSLDLEGTRVADVSPIASLTALTSLNLAGTRVAKADVDSLRRALPNCHIDWP
jgi:internalin A